MPTRSLRIFISALCLPTGIAGQARARDPVLVNITGPLAAQVEEKVAFEEELVNHSGRPLQGLRVVDYFDKGFHHRASASPIESRGTIDMAAGTSRRLTLDFSLDEPGRQCHRVEILDQAHNYMGGATECVQVSAATTVQQSAVPAPVATATAPLRRSSWLQHRQQPAPRNKPPGVLGSRPGLGPAAVPNARPRLYSAGASACAGSHGAADAAAHDNDVPVGTGRHGDGGCRRRGLPRA